MSGPGGNPITPEFLFDLESNMRQITANSYQTLTQDLWWTKVAKAMPSGSKRERLIWLLDTARIRRMDDGNQHFEDMVSQTTEFEALFAGEGLTLKKSQLEDLDGNGVDAAAHWSRMIGLQSAYWPQEQVANAIKANPTTYDALAFFHTAHPVNPYNPGAGTFTNLFTSGSGPGNFNLATADLDDAINYLGSAIAYIATVPQPNGAQPRKLKVAAIINPPALTTKVQQLTKAKFIAQVAGSGAGSGDVEAIVRNWGLGEPIEAPELAAAFGGSDTSFYLLAQEIAGDELGAFVYVDREPFSVIYHGPQTTAELARKREYQWTCGGRNVVGAGHPYKLFKVSAT